MNIPGAAKTSPMWPVSPALTLTERDPKCSCTWVPATQSGPGVRFALKCQDASCPAVRFHRELVAMAGGAS